MTIPTNEAQEADAGLREAVEQLLSVSLEQPVHFISMVSLTDPNRRSVVYRCTDGAGGTYIVKRTPGYSADSLVNWEAAPWEIRAFFNDWIGAEFLNRLAVENPVSPRFYGGDARSGFYVLEDLGEHRSLVEPLLHGDPLTAEDTLMRYATTLGRMHALTAGKAADYAALYQERLPGARPFADELYRVEPQIEQLKANLAGLGVPWTAALNEEVQTVVETARQPGPFRTFIHGDPCPDNQFDLSNRTEGRYLLIDFEMAHFGHALLDAVYPRMIWQTCWCANRLPGDVVARYEVRYRAELVIGVPAAGNDETWEKALLQVCGFVLLMTLCRHLGGALVDDRTWGISTIRQRILARLDALIAAAEQFNGLPALREMARETLEVLSARWHETPTMPLYPAFR
jgi:hypothetical protein